MRAAPCVVVVCVVVNGFWDGGARMVVGWLLFNDENMISLLYSVQ